MHNKIVLLFLIYLICFACTAKQKNNKGTELSSAPEKRLSQAEKEKILTPSETGIVEIELIERKGGAQIQKKKDETIYVQFISDGYNKLSASLSSLDTLANIRFSQIFLPDGTTDGPFGRNLEYPLADKGIYNISVHENSMAGDPWSGIFEVSIQLTQ